MDLPERAELTVSADDALGANRDAARFRSRSRSPLRRRGRARRSPMLPEPGSSMNTLTNSGSLTRNARLELLHQRHGYVERHYVSGSTTVIGSCSAAYAGLPGPFTLLPMLNQLGAVCDGTTDNTTLVNALVNGTNLPVYVPGPSGCYVAESYTALPDGRFIGINGKLITLESATPLPRAYDWAVIGSAPTWTATNVNPMTTGFNGDFSHQHLTRGTYVKGTSTLTQPTTGYVDYPVTAGVYGFYRNTSMEQWHG